MKIERSASFKKLLLYGRALLIGGCVFAYLLLGFYTELELIGRKPLPGHLIEDFNFYQRAYRDAQESGDPYAVRDIGLAFLYPPQALLVVGLFARISSLMLRTAALAATNVVLLSLMIYGVARMYDYRLSDVWWWFPLGLGFAPFLEVVLLGQINVIAQFGIFLMLVFQASAPLAGGLGLTLGIITKVTPLAFVGYLLASRNLRAIAGVALGLAVVTLLAGLTFGWEPFLTFAEVFGDLVETFPLGTNSHSFVALLEAHTPLAAAQVPVVQRSLTLYLLVVFTLSAMATYLSRRWEPSFIVISLGLALAPNVMWYHHYTFLLLPVFVWMAWSRLHPAVVVWCFLGLCLIQVDRLYSFLEVTHGALAHGFGHLSLLMVLIWQLREAVSRLRGGSAFLASLKWRRG